MTKRNPGNYFKNGIKEIYQYANVKTRKEVMRDKILGYVRLSNRNNHFPIYDEINKILHTNLKTYFISIVDVYEKAGINYPCTIKRKTIGDH